VAATLALARGVLGFGGRFVGAAAVAVAVAVAGGAGGGAGNVSEMRSSSSSAVMPSASRTKSGFVAARSLRRLGVGNEIEPSCWERWPDLLRAPVGRLNVGLYIVLKEEATLEANTLPLLELDARSFASAAACSGGRSFGELRASADITFEGGRISGVGLSEAGFGCGERALASRLSARCALAFFGWLSFLGASTARISGEEERDEAQVEQDDDEELVDCEEVDDEDEDRRDR
jgi:hypothetical protein